MYAPNANGNRVAVGAMILTEAYGEEQANQLEVTSNGSVFIKGLGDHATGTKRGRDERILFACFGAEGSPDGPVEPQGAWKRMGLTEWRPTHRLIWTRGSTPLRIVRLVVEDDTPMLYVRQTFGERWSSVVADPDGDVPVPSFAACRDAFKARLELDFVELLNTNKLLPSSFVQMLRKSNEYRNDVANQVISPCSETFGFRNMVPQMGLYHVMLSFAEWYLDVRYLHAQFIKIYMSLKHICPTSTLDVKLLHNYLPGPAGTGKSYTMTAAARCMPEGTTENVVHMSGQQQFADLPHTEEITCRALIFEEAPHSKIGSNSRSTRSGNHAAHSFEDVSSEFKNMLTNRRISSAVLCMSKDGGRKRKLFVVGNDVPVIMAANNYMSMPDSTQSRFTITPCYGITRFDKNEVVTRSMDTRRRLAADERTRHMAYLAGLQMLLDTQQASPFAVPVADEGWNVFVARFEDTLRRKFPYAMSGNIVLTRVLGDAFQFLRMWTNFTATYLTFGHENAEFADVSNFTHKAFRTAELFTVPSDELMVMALTMVEEDIFPTLERKVLRALATLAERCANHTVVAQQANAKECFELYYNELVVELNRDRGVEVDTEVAQIEESERQARTDRGEKPRPWRSLQAQIHRMEGIRGPENKANGFMPSGLPAMPHDTDVGTLLHRLEYVEVKQAEVSFKNDAYGVLADHVHSLLSTREESIPHEHIEQILRILNTRNVRGADGTPHKVVDVESVEGATSNKQRYRLIVSKRALDELFENRMSIQAVIEESAHRYTRPGVYLTNKPFCAVQSVSGDSLYLPQYPQAFSIGIHAPTCAIDDVEATNRAVEEARAAGSKWPWADDRVLNVGGKACTCFRKETVYISNGVSMLPEVRQAMHVHNTVRDLRSDGLAPAIREPLACPCDELGWKAHVKRLLGKELAELTPQDQAELSPAHPRSRAWNSRQSAGDNYPFCMVKSYLNSSVRGAPVEIQNRREDRWKSKEQREVEELSRRVVEQWRI